MARRQRLFEMRPDDSIAGIRLSTSALSDEEIIHRVREAVDVKLRSGGLTTLVMRPSRGYLSLVSHAPLHPLSPPYFSLFLIPLCTFTVPTGDEGCVSLPATRSRGREAAGGEPSTCRGAEEEEGRQGGKAQQEDTRARSAGETSPASKAGWSPGGVVSVAVAIREFFG